MLHSNVAIVWPELANTGPAMLRYVSLECCDLLAVALSMDHEQTIACYPARSLTELEGRVSGLANRERSAAMHDLLLVLSDNYFFCTAHEFI